MPQQNRATHNQYFDICQRITDLAVDGTIIANARDLSEFIGAEMGISISRTTIKEAAEKVGVGLDSKPPPINGDVTRARLVNLEKRVEHLETLFGKWIAGDWVEPGFLNGPDRYKVDAAVEG